jgi:hypothetical protein
MYSFSGNSAASAPISTFMCLGDLYSPRIDLHISSSRIGRRMNVEIGTETPIFLFWEYLFRNFGILSLQCKGTKSHWSSQHLTRRHNRDLAQQCSGVSLYLFLSVMLAPLLRRSSTTSSLPLLTARNSGVRPALSPEGVCTIAHYFFWRRNPTKTLGFLLPRISHWFFVGFLVSPPPYVQSFLRKPRFLVLAYSFPWFLNIQNLPNLFYL